MLTSDKTPLCALVARSELKKPDGVRDTILFCMCSLYAVDSRIGHSCRSDYDDILVESTNYLKLDFLCKRSHWAPYTRRRQLCSLVPKPEYFKK